MMIGRSYGALAAVSKTRVAAPSLVQGDILVQVGFDKSKGKFQFARFREEDADSAAITSESLREEKRGDEQTHEADAVREAKAQAVELLWLGRRQLPSCCDRWARLVGDEDPIDEEEDEHDEVEEVEPPIEPLPGKRFMDLKIYDAQLEQFTHISGDVTHEIVSGPIDGESYYVVLTDVGETHSVSERTLRAYFDGPQPLNKYVVDLNALDCADEAQHLFPAFDAMEKSEFLTHGFADAEEMRNLLLSALPPKNAQVRALAAISMPCAMETLLPHIEAGVLALVGYLGDRAAEPVPHGVSAKQLAKILNERTGRQRKVEESPSKGKAKRSTFIVSSAAPGMGPQLWEAIKSLPESRRLPADMYDVGEFKEFIEHAIPTSTPGFLSILSRAKPGTEMFVSAACMCVGLFDESDKCMQIAKDLRNPSWELALSHTR